MKFSERFDNLQTGLLAGLVLPFIIGSIIFLFSSGQQSLHEYLVRIADSNIITHSITLCVFPNIVIFLLFNQFDMLKATRGVLAITIIWAVVVFAIKIF
jgi:hypothetical protein